MVIVQKTSFFPWAKVLGRPDAGWILLDGGWGCVRQGGMRRMAKGFLLGAW